MGPDQVGREDGATQAKGRVVSPLESFLLGLKGGDDNEGSEDFFLEDAHVVLDVRKDRRSYEETLAVFALVRFAAIGEGSAFRLSCVASR